MEPDAHRPVDHPEPAFSDALRRHLDAVNRLALTMPNGIDLPDAALTLAISDHLDAIGLDNITEEKK